MHHRNDAHIQELAARLRPILETWARAGGTGTYAEAAEALGLERPLTIHRTTMALERLMLADAAAGRPLLAALVVSRDRDGLPAPGFFDLAGELGRHAPGSDRAAAAAYHRREVQAVFNTYGACAD